MVTLKRMIMALAVIVMLTANAYASLDDSMVTTQFEGWTSENLATKAADFGIQLTGNWAADGSLVEMKFPGNESAKMTFAGGATYVNAIYNNWYPGERWVLEFDNDVDTDLLPFAYGDAEVDGNLVEIALLNPVGAFEFSLPDLTLNSITFLGKPFGQDGLGGTEFSYLGYAAAPTPIPGSVLLPLSSLVGMVGIRRFVA